MKQKVLLNNVKQMNKQILERKYQCLRKADLYSESLENMKKELDSLVANLDKALDC